MQKKNEQSEIFKLRVEVYKHMLSCGLTQWSDEYPADENFAEDIKNGNLYVAIIDDVIAGYITIDKNIPVEYNEVSLEFGEPKVCIHRLSVNPKYLRQGIAFSLMEFAIEFCIQNGYNSICLDTREDNKGALALYEKLCFTIRGYVHFPGKYEFKYPVMEIDLRGM